MTQSQRPLGYWVDERVPDFGPLLAPFGIDAALFAEWLGPLLGDYRGALQVRAALPGRNEEIDALRDFCQTADKMVHMLRYGGLPPFGQAMVHAEALRSGMNWTEVADRLRNDLQWLSAHALVVQRRFEATAATRAGRPSTRSRDALINSVVEYLKVHTQNAMVARSLAHEILTASGVDVPGKTAAALGKAAESGDALKRPTRRGKNQR